jgi:DNA-binding NarL/FixJ family response regulator
VLTLIGGGLTNDEIADQLFIGGPTIRCARSSTCCRKLGLRDRIQAVILAYESGLVRPGER